MSTPGTAAISAMFSMHDAVSTCSATMTSCSRCRRSRAARLVRAALRKIHRARAGRRILRATHRLPRFLRSIDVGNQHAVRAQVERLLDARRGRRYPPTRTIDFAPPFAIAQSIADSFS